MKLTQCEVPVRSVQRKASSDLPDVWGTSCELWPKTEIRAAVWALAGLLIGCRAAPTTAFEGVNYRPDPKTSACFRVRDVEDFRFLNRRNLIVYAPRPVRVYHVVVPPAAGSLTFVRSLAFESNTGRICGRPGDELVMATPTVERLQVEAVYRLDEPGLAALREAFAGQGDDSAWGRSRPPR